MTAVTAEAPAEDAPRSWPARIEDGVLLAALAAATVLPLVDAGLRPFRGWYIPGGATLVQHLTLWLAFVGGLYAAREGTHLTLSTSELLGHGRVRTVLHAIALTVAAAVVSVLAVGAWRYVEAERQTQSYLPGGVPEWVSKAVMPVGLALLAARFAWKAGTNWKPRVAALVAVMAVLALGSREEPVVALAWPLAVLVVGSALLGAPLFVALAGVAVIFFWRDGTPVSAVATEVYRLVASPTLPAIPLLTAAGYVLAEGRSAQRLVRFCQALFGWMPGGIPITVAIVCAVLSTNGSGVTIIALGGLIYRMLREAGYDERFSLGLVTSAGSLGLLFPPSVPVILYSVVAGVPAESLYLAGVVPGLLLVVLTSIYGIREGLRLAVERPSFSVREAAASTWDAKWELSLPFVVAGLFAGGWVSIVEASAAACAYAVVVACFITRDLHFVRELPAVLLRSLSLVGAVLLLLAMAMGFTGYLVDAQIPAEIVAWVKAHIHSRVVFLLALNAVLLVLGSVIEVYSAIIVLVPLLVPAARTFDVDPLHLGIVFLANLELGFLFPPVGLNLFLTSARFERPLTQVYRDALPFLLILGAGVLLITYMPELSLWLPRWLGKLP